VSNTRRIFHTFLRPTTVKYAVNDSFSGVAHTLRERFPEVHSVSGFFDPQVPLLDFVTEHMPIWAHKDLTAADREGTPSLRRPPPLLRVASVMVNARLVVNSLLFLVFSLRRKQCMVRRGANLTLDEYSLSCCTLLFCEIVLLVEVIWNTVCDISSE